MKLSIRPLWDKQGWRDHPPGQTCRLPLGGGLVRLNFDENAPTQILCNGELVTPASAPGEFVKTCTLGRFRKFVFSIQFTGGRTDHVEVAEDSDSRLPDDLMQDLANFDSQLRNWLSNELPTAPSLWASLRAGTLTLLQRIDPQTAINKNWKLKEVRDALSSLRLVCLRPREHLVNDEAVRPVESVRRTGPASLRHLASHSEHWNTRTFSGLRPSHLLAQITDDNWDLYENRFAISALHRVEGYIEDIEVKAAEAYLQATRSLDLMHYRTSLATHRSSKNVLGLLLPNIKEGRLIEGLFELESLKTKLDRITEQLSSCRKTRFYTIMQNCSEVFSPILPTNILMMDGRYRTLFDLWQLLDRAENEYEQSGTGELPADLNQTYSRLCQVILIAALGAAGFRPVDPNHALVDVSGNNFQAGGTYKLGAWYVTLNVESDPGFSTVIRLCWRRLIESKFDLPNNISLDVSSTIEGRYSINNSTITFYDSPTNEEKEKLKRLVSIPKDKWGTTQRKKFIEEKCRIARPAEEHESNLIPILARLGPDDPNLSPNSEELLTLAEAHSSKHVSAILLTPAVLSSTSGTSVAPSVLGRLRNYGDSFQGKDSERWGNYRVGMLPLGRGQFHSLSWMIHLIQIQTLRRDFEQGRWPDRCPVCSYEEKPKEEEKHSFSCRNPKCGAYWGITTCGRTAQCGQRFAWIRPGWKPKRESAPDLESNYGSWLEIIEDMPNPETGITAMPAYCQANDEERFRFPMCPRCGHCSGEGSLSAKCLRCSEIRPRP